MVPWLGEARHGRDWQGLARHGPQCGKGDGDMYKALKVKLVGITALLLHNGQLSDPLNEYARALKKVSGKRKKTDEDIEEMARIEFLGGLYLDKNGEPCLPGEVLEAVIRDGAKRIKAGKDVQAAVICDGNFALVYKGPRKPDEMWKDKRFVSRARVKVGQAAVMRTRPLFAEGWSANVVVQYDEDLIDRDTVVEAIKHAQSKGICDWRPKFGRFAAEF
jgi:hypothetical protein